MRPRLNRLIFGANRREAILLVSVLFCASAFGQPYPVTLHGFGKLDAPILKGQAPDSTLVETSPGVFYGTAEIGGLFGCGTLFKITSVGVFTKLHDFTPKEGCSPSGRLVQAGDGYLYGTTAGNFFEPANSVLFRSDLAGTVTTVQVFASHSDPLRAQAPTLAADGSIYTIVTAFQESVGVQVYPVSSVVYHYGLDGTKGQVGSPFAVGYVPPPLIQGNDGNLYGVFSTSVADVTYLDVFRVSAGAVQSLFAVPDPVQGDAPVAIGQGSDNKLYFATLSTLASVQLNGRGYTVVGNSGNDFCEVFQTGFLLGSDGQLYGGCGAYVPEVNGAIYLVGTSGFFGPYTAVFGGAVRLASQSALAAEGSDGNFYGEIGGVADPDSSSYNGGIYSLATGLAAPAPTVSLLTPSSGTIGSTVVLYGDHLLEAKAVSFGGLPASFSAIGVNLISAVVPAGASSSRVSVTTPNGTGVSGSKFVVTQ